MTTETTTPEKVLSAMRMVQLPSFQKHTDRGIVVRTAETLADRVQELEEKLASTELVLHAVDDYVAAGEILSKAFPDDAGAKDSYPMRDEIIRHRKEHPETLPQE